MMIMVQLFSFLLGFANQAQIVKAQIPEGIEVSDDPVDPPNTEMIILFAVFILLVVGGAFVWKKRK